MVDPPAVYSSKAARTAFSPSPVSVVGSGQRIFVQPVIEGLFEWREMGRGVSPLRYASRAASTTAALCCSVVLMGPG